MKNLFILGVFLILSTSVLAQYPEVTIMDIQYQDPSGLIIYFFVALQKNCLTNMIK